jgi:hypothetical protein
MELPRKALRLRGLARAALLDASIFLSRPVLFVAPTRRGGRSAIPLNMGSFGWIVNKIIFRIENNTPLR